MKKILLSVFGAAALSFSLPSFAADGCKALLCFANPNGPMAVSECVPTVKEVLRDMAKGDPFPTCFGDDGQAINGSIGLRYTQGRLLPLGKNDSSCHPELAKNQYEGSFQVPRWICTAGYAVNVKLEGIEPFTYYTVPQFWDDPSNSTSEVQYWRDKNGVAKKGQRF